MPIMSFNISDNLKKFLKKMVQHNEYKNNSYVMRDALVRLMSEKDGLLSGDIDLSTEISSDLTAMLPLLSSSVLITTKLNNPKLDRKLNRVEVAYHNSIIHKSSFIHQDIKTTMFILEDNMENIQSFITEINSFEELQSFRYVINENEE